MMMMDVKLKLHTLAEQLREAVRDNQMGNVEGACRRMMSVAHELTALRKRKHLTAK